MTLGKFSFYRKGIKNKKSSAEINLEDALNKIKDPEQKDLIEKIRTSEDKSVKKVLKDGLEYFTFSGTFKTREANNLLQHSGMIIMDFDLNGWHKYKDENGRSAERFVNHYNIAEEKSRLGADKYTLCAFVSPSGDGVKVLVKINPEKHLESFKWLENYYKENFNLNVDESGKDVSRACYISYDPDPFLNIESEIAPFIVSADSENRPTSPAKHLTQPLREHFKIDEETGELLDLNEIKNWPRQRVEELDRADAVAGRVFAVKRDVTSSYDDWQMIAFSLATFGEHGRALFHKVSQFNEEYKEADADNKFTNALKTGRFTSAAKFFTICKTYGIETGVKRTVAPAVAEGAEGAGFQDFRIELPLGCEMTPELREHIFMYSFIEHNNQYWYGKFDNDKRTVDFYPISNFIITPLFLIRSRSEPLRIVEIKNMYGRNQVLDIKTEAFVSPQMLYACFEANGNFLFDGDRKQLQKIKSKLYNNSKDALPLNVLGWHKDGFYAFANGIYTPSGFIPTDDYGIVEFEKNQYFIAALSSIYKEEEETFEAQKKFVFIKNKIGFRDWAVWFIKIHGDNGKIALCYYLTSLFRDIIYARHKFFPHLFGFGPPGTGKSAMAWSLTSMFGQPQTPFNLANGTRAAFHKTFAMFRNAIVWFDEYKNSIEPQRIESIKSAYDGGGHQKSEMTQANRTVSTPVYSAATLTGQELPTADNALFKRVILCEFHVTHRSEEERKNLDAFREMEAKGLSHITAHLTTLRPLFEQNFEDIYQSTITDIKEVLGANYSNIESRIVINFALILAGYRTLEIPLSINMPVTYKEMLYLFAEKIETQNKLIGNSKETSMFWDIIQYLFTTRQIKDNEDFKIEVKSSLKVNFGNDHQVHEKFFINDATNERESHRVLFLRLSKTHPLYLTEHRKQFSKNGMDKGSIIHYLQHETSYLGKVNSTRFDGANTFAYCFDYEILEAGGVKLNTDTEPEPENKPATILGTNEIIQFKQDNQSHEASSDPF